MIMSREQFEEQVENLKKSSAKKFYSMVEYIYDDIDNSSSIQIKKRILILYCKIYLLTIGKLRLNF